MSPYRAGDLPAAYEPLHPDFPIGSQSAVALLAALNSYYGFGKGIDLGVQSVTTPADCLLVDNVDDFVPADRVFWVGANRQQAAFLLGERLTLSLAPHGDYHKRLVWGGTLPGGTAPVDQR